VLLRIRPDAYLVGGAKISDDHITITLMDFEGTEAQHHVAPLPRGETAEDVVEHLRQGMAEALGRIGRGIGELDCLGVGLPGFIDAAAGLVHWSPCFHETGVDFGRMLEAAFPFPVFLDNDANLAALAEQWFGYGKGVADFLVVTIEHGVGMGIVLDHRLFRGTRGIGAEFGHTKVQIDGALCRCGQRGCLEAYVADYALLREAAIALERDLDRPETPKAELDALFAAAKAGDAAALSIFNRAGRMFSIGLANLINIFDPALIIFSGEQMRYDFLYGARVLEQMRENALLPRPAAAGDPGAQVGRAALGDGGGCAGDRRADRPGDGGGRRGAGRGGGALRRQMIAWRTRAETHSLTTTVPRMTRMISVTCGQASVFRLAWSCMPMPPAPTRPEDRAFADVDVPAEHR
jgi:transcriptional regulator of PTS gene